MTAAELIPAITAQIVRSFDPVRVILFGSQARGDARLDGDIDLLIVPPQASDKRRTAIEIRRALARFPIDKDIIVTMPDEIERRGNLVGTVLRPAPRRTSAV